jgi:hypothetical protein
MALPTSYTSSLVRDLLLLEADEVLAGDRIEDAAPEEHEERRIAVARRLYVQYSTLAARELPKLLRELPKQAALLAAARLTDVQPDARQLELARLRAWAARQLARTQGVRTQGAVLVRTFVYLTLRDVCDWERAHVEPAAVEVDRRTARDSHYDGFAFGEAA